MTGPEAVERTPLGAVVYREPARPWTTVWLVFGILVALCLLDTLVFGSGIPVGFWIIAIVLITGVYALLIYSARATRSLVLTTDELWVGDEMLVRREIVGSTPGIAARSDEDLPVLGWPTGMPRLVRGMTVRLADDRDVVIPTRKIHDLENALGVAIAEPRSVGAIRRANAADLVLLAGIDRRAGIVFRLAGYDLPEIEFAVDELPHAAAIFVVGDPPVAFVWLRDVDELAYVEEISVLPSAMRRGIGTALLEHACAWARDAGYPAVALATYADVPWNGPFYAACGFLEVDDVPPGLAAIRAREIENGLDAVGRRVVMRRDL
ncbi:MAG: GNAT family N-acetyltransferase [Jatrophihabitans sp.]